MPHVKNARVLDDFESCLRMIETLFGCVNPYRRILVSNPKLITQVHPLVRRVEGKIEDTYRKFKRSIEEAALVFRPFGPLAGRDDDPALGCYFCSRPFMRAYFKAATIKVDGINLRVYGCHICVAELKVPQKGEGAVLPRSGAADPLVLVDNYKPMEQYWDLNRRKPDYQGTQHRADGLRRSGLPRNRLPLRGVQE